MSRPRPVSWLKAHPGGADALLALVFGVVTICGLAAVSTDAAAANRDTDALAYVLALVVTVLVGFRRRDPVRALCGIVAALVPYWILDYVDPALSVGALIVLYTVGAHVDRPRSLRAAVATGAVLTSVLVVGNMFDEQDLPAVAVIGNAVIFATAYTIGDSVRSRRAYLAEVEARAEQAERDREADMERAVQDERVRIARELHDVVAHSVSVMVVQAGAARRVVSRAPEQAAESLGVIEVVGRDALTELRRMLGVLRDGAAEADTEPVPTGHDVVALVDQSRARGMDVRLALDRPSGSQPLPASVGLTVYRIVQEALTNVLKHAGPARVEVSITERPDGVTVEVADDGRGPRPDLSTPSAGHGLIGMGERVDVFGGVLVTGPRRGGGFVVRADIPMNAVVAP